MSLPRILLVAACALMLTPFSARCKPPRTDCLGDPLPLGARARLGTARLRHGDILTSVVFTPDGKTLVSAGHDNAIRFWDATSGKPCRPPLRCPQAVASLALTPDGKLLASGGHDDNGEATLLCLWDVASGRQQGRLAGHGGSINTLAFSPDGKILASGGQDDTIRLWDVAARKERATWRAHRSVETVAFSPDGKLLASCGYGKDKVYLWDTTTGKVAGQLAERDPGPKCLAFSPDGKSVAVGGEDKKRVELWTLSSRKCIRQFRAEHCCALAVSPNGKLLAGEGADGVVLLWDVIAGRALHRLPEHTARVRSIAFAPDGRTMATAAGNSIRLWDVSSGRERLPFAGHHAAVGSVALSADGKTMATGGGGTVYLWDTASGKNFRHLRAGWKPKVGLTPDGKLLAAACYHGRGVPCWDVATGKERDRFKGLKGTLPDSALFSPDLKVAVTWYGDNFGPASVSEKIQVVKTSGDALREIRVERGETTFSLWCVALSSDARLLALSDSAQAQTSCGTVSLWQVRTGKKLARFRPQAPLANEIGFVSLALSAEGALLAAGAEDGCICLWDTRGIREIHMRGHRGAVLGLAFAPDGRMLASAGADGTVRLWEVATGRERRCFEGHHGEVLSVAFGRRGQTLVSGSADTTALLWDVTGSWPEER